MSWYRDPQLFIYSFSRVYRVTKEFGSSPIVLSDLNEHESLNFSEHLSLGNCKESDFDDFKATFPKYGIRRLINCQGAVINWDNTKLTGTWSREELNSPFWSLPGITQQVLADKQVLAVENSELKAKISSLQDALNGNKIEKEGMDKRVTDLEQENAILQDALNGNKVEKEATDKRIADLEQEIAVLKAEVHRVRDENIVAVLDKCSGAARGELSIEEPWITGRTVPRNWVRFEELNVLAISKDVPLAITKAAGGLKFGFDNTTNIQASRFYRGMFPIVLVDVAELTPNREDARFDPYVWGSYNIAGISYAARKPFASEMSFDAQKTC